MPETSERRVRRAGPICGSAIVPDYPPRCNGCGRTVGAWVAGQYDDPERRAQWAELRGAFLTAAEIAEWRAVPSARS